MGAGAWGIDGVEGEGEDGCGDGGGGDTGCDEGVATGFTGTIEGEVELSKSLSVKFDGAEGVGDSSNRKTSSNVVQLLVLRVMA